jgi:hypothetical protein
VVVVARNKMLQQGKMAAVEAVAPVMEVVAPRQGEQVRQVKVFLAETEKLADRIVLVVAVVLAQLVILLFQIILWAVMAAQGSYPQLQAHEYFMAVVVALVHGQIAVSSVLPVKAVEAVAVMG